MQKAKYLYVFISLFFLLAFSSKALAYTMFSANPYFDSDLNYTIAYTSTFLNSPTFAWNATCAGMNGCFLITTNNLTNVQIIPSTQQEFLNTSNSSDYQTTNKFTLPKNEEGIVILSYYSNYTLYGYESYGTYPKLFIVMQQPSYSVLNVTNLNPASGVWNNYTVFVPAVNYERNITVDFGFSSNQPPTEIYIDKFKFYILDDVESVLLWSSNSTIEREYYCGSDSVNACSDMTNCFEISSDGNTGFLLAKDSEGLQCGVFKLGNITVASRITTIEDQSYDCINAGGGSYLGGSILLKTNKGYFLRDINSFSGGSCDNNGIVLFMQQLSHTQTKLTVIRNYSNPARHLYFDSDSSPNGVVTLLNSTDGLLNNYSNAIMQTINITSYKNTTYFAGNNWRFALPTTSWYPFFDYSYITTFSPHWVCDSGTNEESFITSNGTFIQQTSCGDCGCDANASRCNNAGFIGSRCVVEDTNHYLYQTAIGCGLILRSCEIGNIIAYSRCEDVLYHPDFSTWRFGNYSVACYNWATHQAAYCVDSSGNNVTCSSILSNITSGEPVAQSVDWINSLFGTLGSFVIALITSFGISIYILWKSHKNGLPAFMVSIMISLGGFTYIGMFPQWFYALAVIFIVLGIYWSYKGGKD